MPPRKKTVLETKPLLPWYEVLVAEVGEPGSNHPLPDLAWEPWTLRGAYEMATGRTDYTAWTVGDAQRLRALEAGPSLLGLTDELPQLKETTA